MTTIFITGTSTNVGKTWLTRALAIALSAPISERNSERNSTLAPIKIAKIAAIKPFETGISALAESDAERIDCSGRLWRLPAWVRLSEPVAPLAAKLKDPSINFDLNAMSQTVSNLQGAHDVLLIEGAGGPLVPIDLNLTISDLVRQWTKHVLLVAPNQLGTISHTLTSVESLRSRSFDILAIALITQRDSDPSVQTNRRILEDQTGVHVLEIGCFTSPEELRADPGCQKLATLIRQVSP